MKVFTDHPMDDMENRGGQEMENLIEKRASEEEGPPSHEVGGSLTPSSEAGVPILTASSREESLQEGSSQPATLQPFRVLNSPQVRPLGPRDPRIRSTATLWNSGPTRRWVWTCHHFRVLMGVVLTQLIIPPFGFSLGILGMFLMIETPSIHYFVVPCLYRLCWLLFGPFARSLVQVYNMNHRSQLIVGCLVFFTGYVINVFMTNKFWMITCYGCIAGVGTIFLESYVNEVVSYHYPENKGVVTMTRHTVAGLGLVFVPSAIATILPEIGFHATVRNYSVLAFFVLLVACFIFPAWDSNPSSYSDQNRPEVDSTRLTSNMISNTLIHLFRKCGRKSRVRRSRFVEIAETSFSHPVNRTRTNQFTLSPRGRRNPISGLPDIPEEIDEQTEQLFPSDVEIRDLGESHESGTTGTKVPQRSELEVAWYDCKDTVQISGVPSTSDAAEDENFSKAPKQLNGNEPGSVTKKPKAKSKSSLNAVLDYANSGNKVRNDHSTSERWSTIPLDVSWYPLPQQNSVLELDNPACNTNDTPSFSIKIEGQAKKVTGAIQWLKTNVMAYMIMLAKSPYAIQAVWTHFESVFCFIAFSSLTPARLMFSLSYESVQSATYSIVQAALCCTLCCALQPCINGLDRKLLTFVYSGGCLIAAVGLFILGLGDNADTLLIGCILFGGGHGISIYATPIVLETKLGLHNLSKIQNVMDIASAFLLVVVALVMALAWVINAELVYCFYVLVAIKGIASVIWLIQPGSSTMRVPLNDFDEVMPIV